MQRSAIAAIEGKHRATPAYPEDVNFTRRLDSYATTPDFANR